MKNLTVPQVMRPLAMGQTAFGVIFIVIGIGLAIESNGLAATVAAAAGVLFVFFGEFVKALMDSFEEKKADEA